MKSLTSYLMICVAWGVIGCQRPPLNENSRLEVFIPGVVKGSSWFQEQLQREELLLEISVESQGKVIWHHTLTRDLFQTLQIPSEALEDSSASSMIRIEISIRRKQEPSHSTPFLKGGREIQKEALLEPIFIYLSLQSPILEGQVDELEFY